MFLEGICVKYSWLSEKCDVKIPDNILYLKLLVNILSIREFRVEKRVGNVIKGINAVDISLNNSRQCVCSIILCRSIFVSPAKKHFCFVVEFEAVSKILENSFMNVLSSSICLWGGL